MCKYLIVTQDLGFNKPLPSRKLGIVLVNDGDLGEEEELHTGALVQMCYKIPTSADTHVLVHLCICNKSRDSPTFMPSKYNTNRSLQFPTALLIMIPIHNTHLHGGRALDWN